MKTIYAVCALAYELRGQDDGEINESFICEDEDVFTSDDVEKATDYYYDKLKTKEPLSRITPDISDFYTVYLRLEKCTEDDVGNITCEDVLEEDTTDWLWSYEQGRWV